MTAIESRISAILAEPLAAAARADRAVGYVGLDIPEDLLAASAIVSCHLPWSVGWPTPRADRWLEPSFPGWARSILEDWATGRFDLFDSVIFTRGDDAAQRLYYYVCELQRRRQLAGPKPLIFDTAKIRRPSSVDWTVGAVTQLAKQLELSDADLRNGIQEANRRRELFSRISLARGNSGSFCERIVRASLFDRLDEFEWPAEPPQTHNKGRLLLAGSSPPDDRLHTAAEAAGWSVVGESCDRSLDRLGPVLEDSADDAASLIARHCHGLQRGPRGFTDRAGELGSLARSTDADAVVIWLIEEDEALAWDLVAMRGAVQSLHIPLLAMTRRQWDCSDNAAGELKNFLRGLPT
jgi:hypothetical protein